MRLPLLIATVTAAVLVSTAALAAPCDTAEDTWTGNDTWSSTPTPAPSEAEQQGAWRDEWRQRSNSKPAPSTPAAAPPSTTTTGDGNTLETRMLDILNSERSKAGCGPLQLDPALQEAARAHSQDMAAHNYFSHTGRNGSTPIQRMKAAGWTGSSRWAENISAGRDTAEATMAGLMNSSGHRANILNCTYRHVGVGVATGGGYGIYWTQDFAG